MAVDCAYTDQGRNLKQHRWRQAWNGVSQVVCDRIFTCLPSTVFLHPISYSNM